LFLGKAGNYKSNVSVSPLSVSLKKSYVIASEAKQSHHFPLPAEIALALRASQ
jgi:hypothetical protein